MSDSEAEAKIYHSEKVADKSKKESINLDVLAKHFESGERVTLEAIKERVPQFNKKATYVKVLARGRLDKKLIVEADDFSVQAAKMILLTGGEVIETVSE